MDSWADFHNSLTHLQWIYRNHTVHFKYDDLTSNQDDTIMSTTEVLLDIDPEDLLLEHRKLLSYDFERMGEASASERQYWIADMEAATSAGDRVHNRAEQSIHSCHDNQMSQSTRAPVVLGVNDQRTIQWRHDD